MSEPKCEGCGMECTAHHIVGINLMNGHLNLCRPCLAELNGKNPELRAVLAAAGHVGMGKTPAEVCDGVIRAHDRIVVLQDRVDELEAEVRRLRECEEVLRQERAECDALRSTLLTIREWDCLNPPAVHLCADLGWLRRVVDAALTGAPAAEVFGELLANLNPPAVVFTARDRLTGAGNQ